MSVAFCITAILAAGGTAFEAAAENGGGATPNYFPYVAVMLVMTVAAVVLRLYGA